MRKVDTMRKIFLFVMIIAATVAAAESQDSKVKLFADVGYAFPRGSQPVPNIDTLNAATEDAYLNCAKGITLQAGGSLAVMPHLSAMVTLNGSFAAPRATYENQIAAYANIDTYHMTTFGLDIALQPSFRLFDLLDCDAFIGAGLHFASIDIEGSNLNFNQQEGYIDVNPAFALIGGIGASLPLTEKLSLRAVVDFKDVAFKVAETRQTNNGASQVLYDKDNGNQPAPYRISGSTLGIKLGLSFGL